MADPFDVGRRERFALDGEAVELSGLHVRVASRERHGRSLARGSFDGQGQRPRRSDCEPARAALGGREGERFAAAVDRGGRLRTECGVEDQRDADGGRRAEHLAHFDGRVPVDQHLLTGGVDGVVPYRGFRFGRLDRQRIGSGGQGERLGASVVGELRDGGARRIRNGTCIGGLGFRTGGRLQAAGGGRSARRGCGVGAHDRVVRFGLGGEDDGHRRERQRARDGPDGLLSVAVFGLLAVARHRRESQCQQHGNAQEDLFHLRYLDAAFCGTAVVFRFEHNFQFVYKNSRFDNI